MLGADVPTATTIANEIDTCQSFPCVIAVDETLAYIELRDACDSAQGVFHEFYRKVTFPVDSLTIRFAGRARASTLLAKPIMSC
jgi:hypothetical protein